MLVTLMLVACGGFACRKSVEIPDSFPTPPAPPAATPVKTPVLKEDADLEKKMAGIAASANGRVGAAAVVLETGDAALLAPDEHFPMQSVYKLPISMAVMEQISQERLALDEQIGVTRDDMVEPSTHSPLRDADPNGGIFTVRELIRLALEESDGSASDVLMRVADGPDAIQTYLTHLSILNIKVVNTEKEMGADWPAQYQNWATPRAAVELLDWLYSDAQRPVEPDADPNGSAIIMSMMADSSPGAKRLKGLLPAGTVVAHKTGTSGAQDGLTAATNDIGIITMPNGRHLVIAVFVSDSTADEKTRESVIAKIGKACWDVWANQPGDAKTK